jgi:hypothetical protein
VTKIVSTVFFGLFMTVVASAQSSRGTWLHGTWEGTGYQIDSNSTWTMSLRARGKKFLIEYPSLNRRGVWSLISIGSWKARFREKITFGIEECADKGNVVIQRLNRQQIAFRYSYPGTKAVSASAILNRKR